MINHESIQDRVYELGARGGMPAWYLKIFKESSQDGMPHIEIVNDTYHYVVQERGCEFSRRETHDIDELLFWVLNDASWRYAFDYEFEHRVLKQDSRRLAFKIKSDVMERINPEWSEIVRVYIENTLKNAPYVD